MDVLFECFMNLSFYAALILLFARLGKKDVTVRTIDCFTAATMGIGFLIGAISKWMTHPMKWTAALLHFWRSVICNGSDFFYSTGKQ